MIDHMGVIVSDYAKSKAFYAKALVPTGHAKVVEIPAGNTTMAGFCHPDGSDFWITPGDQARRTTPIHVAFRVATRVEVDAFHAAAIAAGGRDNGAPGLRPQYHANYYGAFVLDPDGHNIEAVCHDPP